MNIKTIGVYILLGALSLTGCQPSGQYVEVIDNPEYLRRSVKALTDVIVHDIFSPPVASRIYAYPSIAAYEVIIQDKSTYRSLAGQLNELKPIPKPPDGLTISYPLAGIHAYLTIGKALIFSEAKIDAFRTSLYTELRAKDIPGRVFKNSLEYGETVAQHILDWADTDMYKETRTYPKYSIPEDPAMWQPTPPDYMEGIEPHWREIRPFVIDSAEQFVPQPPTPFSTDPKSRFYEEVLEVYHVISDQPDESPVEEKVEIAKFWDCNPYVSVHHGHAMFATKKITPGGHWIGITSLVTRKAKSDFVETAEAYAWVSIALADAFISCWDEKYRSNLIRPETYINQYIDPEWKPVLQTPPFPEHTSGHSVISAAAAEALTHLYGEPFYFADSVEVEYGLPVREFDSFREASLEAAISRLYGGIHYRPAIDYGVYQGRQIGQFIIDNLDTNLE